MLIKLSRNKIIIHWVIHQMRFSSIIIIVGGTYCFPCHRNHLCNYIQAQRRTADGKSAYEKLNRREITCFMRHRDVFHMRCHIYNFHQLDVVRTNPFLYHARTEITHTTSAENDISCFRRINHYNWVPWEFAAGAAKELLGIVDCLFFSFVSSSLPGVIHIQLRWAVQCDVHAVLQTQFPFICA